MPNRKVLVLATVLLSPTFLAGVGQNDIDVMQSQERNEPISIIKGAHQLEILFERGDKRIH